MCGEAEGAGSEGALSVVLPSPPGNGRRLARLQRVGTRSLVEAHRRLSRRRDGGVCGISARARRACGEWRRVTVSLRRARRALAELAAGR